MKVLIYEPNGQLQKYLTSYLLRAKLTPQVVDRESALMSALSTRDYEIFITDYSAKEDVINDIIFNIKLDAKLSFIKIFISTPRPERDVLQTLIQLGVNGFIKKPFTAEQFQQVFSGWMAKNSFTDNKRIHTRVRPAPSDNAFIYFRLTGYAQEIPGEIIDISVGGIAAMLPRSFERLMGQFFAAGNIIQNVRLKIRQAAVRVNLEVITWVENRLSLKFHNLDEKTSKYILNYIADNLEP